MQVTGAIQEPGGKRGSLQGSMVRGAIRLGLNSKPLIPRAPFIRGAPSYYVKLGAPEPRRHHRLEFVPGDPIIGSMNRHWKRWRDMGAPRLLCQWLHHGVPLRWSGPAPRVTNDIREPVANQEVLREMRKMEEDGAFVETSGEDVVLSPIFLIPKRDGGRRLIHDLRYVNRFLKAPHFTLHGIQDTAAVVRRSEWLCSLDLKRGYQQLLMSQEARKFLGTRIGGRTLVSTVLPFGLNISPYIFTRYTNWVAGLIRRKTGLNVACYIDDFILGGQTKEDVERGLKKVKEMFRELGLVLSDKKETVVARETEFLGFTWSAERKTIGVTEERRREYKRRVKNLLRTPQPAKRWRSVIGKLIFLRDAVGQSLRHVRSLLRAVRGTNLSKKITPEGEVKEDLHWWLQMLAQRKEISLIYREVTASITTDASEVGLGYVLEVGKLRIEKSIPVKENGTHINTRELQALMQCLDEQGGILAGRKVNWWGDNITALAAVRREGTQNLGRETWYTTKKILDILAQRNIQLVPRYVPSALNKTADDLSRLNERSSGWEQALRSICNAWGPCTTDPFGLTQVPKTPWQDLKWIDQRALLKPPTRDIPEILNILKEVHDGRPRKERPSMWERCAVLITPTWQGALWWSQLEALRVGWLDLGRIPDKNLADWETRNGRSPSWTASLVATRRVSDLNRPKEDTNQSRGDLEHGWEQQSNRKKQEASQNSFLDTWKRERYLLLENPSKQNTEF